MHDARFAARIDHTLLAAEASLDQLHAWVDEALTYGFAAVCVNGCYLPALVRRLKSRQLAASTADAPAATRVKAAAVVAFPLGSMSPTLKAIEATSLAKAGADELDFVAHLPALLAGDPTAAREDFLAVTSAAREVSGAIVVKVILETALLMQGVSPAEGEKRIALACQAAAEAGCDFVKTSTGFHPAGGATVEAVRLLRKHAPHLQVKASGGIRTRDDALRMLDAGADRLGCSASVAIVSHLDAPVGGY